MRNFYRPFLCALTIGIWLYTGQANAQVTVTYNSNAMQLVQNLVGNGVIVTSATLTCPAVGSGTFTTSGACSSVGVPQGIVLTSGDLINVPGPNNSGSAGVDNAGGGSPLLDPLAGASTQDGCILTFTFIPTTGSINFNYMFGSEEYPEFVNSGYNDAFGFFLTGPNPSGPAYNNTNLAVIPSTSTPVTIDNVNSGSNSAYYMDNTGGTCYQYDGFTTVLSAQANVTPCNTYTITIAVADAGDGYYDSGVMLQENSFSSGNFDAVLVSQTNATCSTLGSATVSASGGTAPYTYTWNTSPVQNTPTATNLGAGNYTCVVSYSVCSQVFTDTVQVTITSASTVTATITSQTNVSCNGGNNGSATVTPGGSAGPFTYVWAPSGGNGATANNLTAGTYTVTVSAGGGCTSSTTVTITEPAGMSLPTSHLDATCGSANGSATVTPSGGAGGYTYAWMPSGGNSATANGLLANTYTVTVTDANGCTSSTTVVVANSGAPTATISSQTDVTCYGGNNGSATVNAAGGGGGYTYNWAPSGGSGATANALTAGTYTVTVTDVNSCTSSTTVTITEPTQVTATIPATTDITCFGMGDGTANCTANGGVGGYTYTWAPSGGSNANATGMGSGTYTVTVTDANGCTATASATINEPTAVTLAIASQTDVTCFGYNDGTVSLTGGGGTGALSYNWLPGGAGNSSNTLSATTYTVTVSDQNGCTATVSFSITEPAGMVLNLTATDDSICAGDPVTLTMNAAGGSGGYTYTWNGTPGTATANVNPGTTTPYAVVVTDANGCTQSQSATIEVGPVPTASFTASNVCEGQAVNFNNTSNGNGGTIIGQGWDFGDLSPVSLAVSPSHTYATSGTYNVTLTVGTDFGCTSSVTVPVTVDPIPQVNFSADQLSGCVPLCVNFSDLTNAGSGAITSWDWQANGVNISNLQNPNYCFNTPGSYDISLNVVSNSGCTASLNIPNYIQVSNIPVADFTMSGDYIPESDPLVYFTDASLGGVSSWNWDFGDGTFSTDQNPAHVFSDTGAYCITLTVASALGCQDDIQYCLYIYPEVFIYIPNTFTPNDDAINENFLVYGRGLLDATLLIFDRWGEPVARLDKDQPFTIGWDGRYNGEKVKEDVYTYKLFVIDVKGDKHEYHGHVNVIY